MSAKGRPWVTGNPCVDNEEQMAACFNCTLAECINCHGYKPAQKGKRNELKKPIDQFDLAGNFLKRWPSSADASDGTGNYAHTISNFIRGPSSRAGKFIWRYAEC